jgi:hypothetical protein
MGVFIAPSMSRVAISLDDFAPVFISFKPINLAACPVLDKEINRILSSWN